MKSFGFGLRDLRDFLGPRRSSSHDTQRDETIRLGTAAETLLMPALWFPILHALAI